MSRNRFQQLLQYLHFVDNNNIDKNDKSAKIKPISEAVRNEFVKVEPDEFHSIDEQIIPSKTKFSSIHQYSPKKPKNGDLIILSVLGPLVLCTTYIIRGKITTNLSTVTTVIYNSILKLLQGLPRSYQME